MDIFRLQNIGENLLKTSYFVLVFNITLFSVFLIGSKFCLIISDICSPVSFYIPEPILVPLYILNISYFFLVFLKGVKGLYNYRRRARTAYEFNPIIWPKGWIYSGKPEVKNDELYVNSSRAGLLLEDVLWKNFQISFELKFGEINTERSNLGIIFRAQDFDNYLMIEIRNGFIYKNRENKVQCDPPALNSYIKYKSGMQLNREEPLSNINLSYFNKFTLNALNRSITINCGRSEIFHWFLPTHVDVEHFEGGTEKISNPDDVGISSHVQQLLFTTKYGMVGFRSHRNSRPATIRNIKIGSLPD